MEANRLKGTFIEVASHELNTPVAVVLGLTDLWKMTQGARRLARRAAWVDRIHGGRQAAGRRRSSGCSSCSGPTSWPSPRLRPMVDLRALIRQVVADLAPVPRGPPPGRSSSGSTPTSARPRSTRPRSADILTNLIVNAIKFTPDGGTIRRRGRPRGRRPGPVPRDRPGLGHRPEDRPHLFEPFFTGNDTMHHSSGDYQYGKRGIGLGLCLVKTFVELHGGTVDVDTAPGRGSTFGFTLPRRNPTARLAPEPDVPATDPRGLTGVGPTRYGIDQGSGPLAQAGWGSSGPASSDCRAR